MAVKYDADVITVKNNRTIDSSFKADHSNRTELYLSSKDIKQGKHFPYIGGAIYGKAYRRRLFLENHEKLNPKITIGEDSAFACCCMNNASSICVVDDNLYYGRIQNESALHSFKPYKNKNNPKYLLEYVEKELKGNSDTVIKLRSSIFIANLCLIASSIASSIFWDVDGGV